MDFLVAGEEQHLVHDLGRAGVIVGEWQEEPAAVLGTRQLHKQGTA